MSSARVTEAAPFSARYDSLKTKHVNVGTGKGHDPHVVVSTDASTDAGRSRQDWRPESDREAILEGLYGDRAILVDLNALGRLSAEENVRLQDIDREIARWQAQGLSSTKEDLWERLERIAARAMEIDAEIERTLGKGK